MSVSFRHSAAFGKRSIWFNGKNTKAQTQHVKPQFEKYVATDFRRILEDDPDAAEGTP